MLLRQLRCPLLMLWGEGDPWIWARERSAKFREVCPKLTGNFLNAGIVLATDDNTKRIFQIRSVLNHA